MIRIDRRRLLDPALPAAIVQRRRKALDLADAALAAVEPEAATARVLVGRQGLRGCTVLAFGKAAIPMARAAIRCCAPRAGIVVAPQVEALEPLRVVQGAHPLPARDARVVGQQVLDLARSLGPDDVVLCLVSGGGSALLELPVDGVTIDQIRERTDALMKAGAPIEELNAARIGWSQLKGGKLARALLPARVVNVILSDVPGQPLSVVASGPTVLDDPRIESVAAANNQTAVQGVLSAAADAGIFLEPAGRLGGEARLMGQRLMQEAAGSFALDPWIDGFVAGGETTVTVRGAGRGGRNGELVLGAAPALYEHLVLSLATDGVDGSSRSAGALLDGSVLEAAPGPIDAALADNDSARWLEAAGGLLQTGPTGTNVADVAIVLR